uniref:Uncharacterized protein n=1 Tax=Eutreptiella gymnastica TaxID=73025 RepID=A0A7S4FEA8_9EUGL
MSFLKQSQKGVPRVATRAQGPKHAKYFLYFCGFLCTCTVGYAMVEDAAFKEKFNNERQAAKASKEDRDELEERVRLLRDAQEKAPPVAKKEYAMVPVQRREPSQDIREWQPLPVKK